MIHYCWAAKCAEGEGVSNAALDFLVCGRVYRPGAWDRADHSDGKGALDEVQAVTLRKDG